MTRLYHRFWSAWWAFRNPTMIVTTDSLERMLYRGEVALIQAELVNGVPVPIVRMLPYNEQRAIRDFLRMP